VSGGRRAAIGAFALVAAAITIGRWPAGPATTSARQLSRTVTTLPASARAVAAGDAPAGAATRGGALFAADCSSCHGLDARGVAGRGPSLRGAGAAAVDFYLSTGRMPLAHSGIEPPRSQPRYDARGRSDIATYLRSLDASGPAIPVVDVADGDVALGRELFASACSGCHQIAGKGGIDPEVTAPPLDDATPAQIAEAVRVGPYLMPRFGPRTLDRHDVDSIARYVTSYGRHPTNRGGWGIGNIGPIPEGLVAWLLAAGSLVLVARVIGTRST
jgi:ubiquinol-cytochrome c reductase cytochrome c subunit